LLIWLAFGLLLFHDNSAVGMCTSDIVLGLVSIGATVTTAQDFKVGHTSVKNVTSGVLVEKTIVSLSEMKEHVFYQLQPRTDSLPAFLASFWEVLMRLVGCMRDLHLAVPKRIPRKRIPRQLQQVPASLVAHQPDVPHQEVPVRLLQARHAPQGQRHPRLRRSSRPQPRAAALLPPLLAASERVVRDGFFFAVAGQGQARAALHHAVSAAAADDYQHGHCHVRAHQRRGPFALISVLLNFVSCGHDVSNVLLAAALRFLPYSAHA